MNTKTLLLTMLLATIFSCKKHKEEYNPQLPPVTQTGANTFGCKINGQIMVPRDGKNTPLMGGYPYGVTYSRIRTQYEHYDWIEAMDQVSSGSNRGAIAFKLPNIDTMGVGEYIIKHVDGAFSQANPNIVYLGAIYNGDSPSTGYSSIENTGKIIITRYDDDVISGTFYCKVKNYLNPNDIIEVTEGRFDFNKHTINTTKFP